MHPTALSRLVFRWASFGVVAAFAVAPAAQAQRSSDARRPDSRAPAQAARFSGFVVDATTREPISAVRITSPSVLGVVLTDSLGRFDIAGVPPGIVRFFVSVAGYPRANFTLAFAPGELMERTLELDSASTEPDSGSPSARALPTVTVEAEAPPPPWLRDFDRRRLSGRGQYLTREEIEKRNYARLPDAVQMMRGVTLDCGGGGSGCLIRMVRAPMRCYPEYWIDGQLNNTWGPTIAVRDIEALEVYTGPTDTPGEFAGRNAGCGTIVIWTSAGLRRRP